MYHIIYKITNLETNKSYIGETKMTIEKRWSSHVRHTKRLHRLQKPLTKFQQEIVNYPDLSKWKLEILENNILPENRIEKEKYYINLYNTLNEGYNSNTGGGGPITHSEETKQKFSSLRKGISRPQHVIDALMKSNKNRVVSEETRLKISIAGKGRKTSDATKEKLRISSTGRTLSQEARQKISDKLTGKKKPKSVIENLKKIHTGNNYNSIYWKIIDPNNNEFIIYNLSKFCRENNLQQANMLKVSNGQRKSHKSYKCFRIDDLKVPGN